MDSTCRRPIHTLIWPERDPDVFSAPPRLVPVPWTPRAPENQVFPEEPPISAGRPPSPRRSLKTCRAASRRSSKRSRAARSSGKLKAWAGRQREGLAGEGLGRLGRPRGGQPALTHSCRPAGAVWPGGGGCRKPRSGTAAPAVALMRAGAVKEHGDRPAPPLEGSQTPPRMDPHPGSEQGLAGRHRTIGGLRARLGNGLFSLPLSCYPFGGILGCAPPRLGPPA